MFFYPRLLIFQLLKNKTNLKARFLFCTSLVSRRLSLHRWLEIGRTEGNVQTPHPYRGSRGIVNENLGLPGLAESGVKGQGESGEIPLPNALKLRSNIIIGADFALFPVFLDDKLGIVQSVGLEHLNGDVHHAPIGLKTISRQDKRLTVRPFNIQYIFRTFEAIMSSLILQQTKILIIIRIMLP